MNLNSNFTGLYFTLIFFLPILIFIISSVILPSDNFIWFNHVEFINMPDISFRSFGYIITILISIFIGYAINKFREVAFNTGKIKMILIYILMAGLILYLLTYNIMVATKSTISGGVISIISALLIAPYLIFNFKESLPLSIISLVVCIIDCYNTFLLFMTHF